MKSFFIQTFGCQMNVHDSQKIKEQLQAEKYTETEDITKADIIIANTCSVRHNPENKVYSFVGRTRRLKEKKKVLLGIAGCVAQQEGNRILKKYPSVDFVFGTDQLFSLPTILQKAEEGIRASYTDWLTTEHNIKEQNFIPTLEKTPVQEVTPGSDPKAMIAIAKGCNNFCSYCIVPYTRGQLISRPLHTIIEEATTLVAQGVKEILLVGQNVNAYKTREHSFYDVLKAVSDIKGLARVRFTSPHPNFWNNELTDLMTDRANIATLLHFPLQSGSDSILKAMFRHHTAAQYKAKVDYLQEKIPNLFLTTDIIVGFPGETLDDFQATLDMIEKVRFWQIYAFKYSPRPGTKSEAMEDSIPLKEKQRRLAALLALQSKIQDEKLDSLVGTKQEILFDSVHPQEKNVIVGTTDHGVRVNVQAPEAYIGEIKNVTISGRKTYSLIGTI